MVYVLSIGGNALDSEMKNIKLTINAIKKLHSRGGLIITHGNGPQVGELARVEHLSLSILTAQTEAEIGYAIKKEIENNTHIKTEVFLTEVLVSKKDKAFCNPTKPIGKYYSKSEAYGLSKKGLTLKKFEKGYRRVVPSPKPIEILNIESMKKLMKGRIMIAGGGGGIPLSKERGKIEFVEAVIDKDYTTSLIAEKLKAKRMFILTNVDGAYLDYGKKEERLIKDIKADEMLKYLKEGHFEEGSMKPKVEACIDFVKKNRGIAAIGNIKKADKVIKLEECTVIRP